MTDDSGTQAAPGRAMLEHGVEDYEKLAHTGCKGQLLRLTGGQQFLVEGRNDWVTATSYQSSHVQGSWNPGASTPHGTSAS